VSGLGTVEAVREAVDAALVAGSMSEEWAAAVYAQLDEPPSGERPASEVVASLMGRRVTFDEMAAPGDVAALEQVQSAWRDDLAGEGVVMSPPVARAIVVAFAGLSARADAHWKAGVVSAEAVEALDALVQEAQLAVVGGVFRDYYGGDDD
jgi:hypothetical protein